MAQLLSLSDEDLAQLRTELAAGRSPMVWFTSAAVGVAAGGSAKIVAFGDVAEGDFIQVRPTGSKDVLSFSPSELTRTRPQRKKPAAKPAKTAPARPAPAKSAPVRPAPAEPAPAPPKPAAAPAKPAAAPAPTPPARTAAAKPAASRRATKPAAPRAAAEVTVTLHSNPAGEWTVEVVVGKKRTVRPTPVGPADVAKAAKSLPAPVADAVDRALESARRQQQDRVATLRAELEAAQRALEDLS